MEKTQDEIVLSNFIFELKHNEYSKYPFKSLGNIIGWLKALGLIQYDTVQIGDNKVTLHGKLLATFIFDEKNEMPIFTFSSEWQWLKKPQELYIESIKKNVVVCDSCKSFFITPKKKCSCGSTSFTNTQPFNAGYAENIKSHFLKIKESVKKELVFKYQSSGGISGVSEQDINEIFIFERLDGSNFVAALLKDKKITYCLNWERFEIV